MVSKKFYSRAFFGLTAFTFLLTTSCNKTTSSTFSQGSLSATVGGASFKASTTVGLFSNTYGIFDITGFIPQGGDTTFLAITLPTIPPVNHPFSSDTTSSELAWYTASGTKSYESFTSFGHAVITVTSWDTIGHTIIGSFSGTLLSDLNSADSIVITNGFFNTQYTVQ